MPACRHETGWPDGAAHLQALIRLAQRQNPSFAVTYHCLASAFAHLGRDDEARQAAAHLLELDPAFTISAWIARGGQSNAKLLIESLRKAGCPNEPAHVRADEVIG